MNTVNLTQARARLSELVSRAEHGEEIVITRRGRAVARLSPTLRPLDLARLRAGLAVQPVARGASAARLVRRMRDLCW